jgi:poly(3-hydroxybutyrate) depolymerase
MGQSSSTSTVGTFACAASERIASFSAGVGSFRPGCTQQRPVPLMAMTGDPDRGTVMRSVDLWAEAYECSSDPIVEDLGSGVTRTAYQGCLADIVLYDVEGVGHGFFRQECLKDGFDYCYENEVFDLLSEVERFFAEHPLPAAE